MTADTIDTADTTTTPSAIRFECPRCQARHRRGMLDGVCIFRCLRCGYQGAGWNADEEIDAGIVADIREGNAKNRAVGLPEEPLSPFLVPSPPRPWQLGCNCAHCFQPIPEKPVFVTVPTGKNPHNDDVYHFECWVKAGSPPGVKTWKVISESWQSHRCP